MNLAVLLAIFIASVAADNHDNCFVNDYIKYAYDLHDFSKNYTNSQEFWLKMDTTCTFDVSTDNKVSWYSSDIKAKILVHYDNGDGSGCRPDPTKQKDPVDYDNGHPIVLGKNSEDYPNSCLVLYEVTNSNKIHDLRIQIFQYGGDRLGSITLKAYSFVAMVAVALSTTIF